jgi:hypothetical protein
MMRPRFAIPLILLLLAAAGIWLVVADRWSTTGKGLHGLFPQSPEEVQRIQVISAYDTLEFRRSDSVWTLDGEELNSEAVENLLYATGRLRMTSILPLAGDDRPEGVIEFVFAGRKRNSGHFYFGKMTGAYAVFEPGADRAFGVELAGYENLPLEKIFSGNRDHYRKHLMVSLLPSEIRTVTVEPHFGTPFRAGQDSLYHITVTDLETVQNVTERTDERKIRLLFSFFNAIRYDGFVSEGEIEPGTVTEQPYAVVEVFSFDGQVHTLEIYQWTKPGQAAPDLFEAIVDFNGMQGYRSVNYYYLDLLIRGLENYSN